MELTRFLCSLSWSFRADIALIGLAVMGQNLILNMNDHGFVVSPENTHLSCGFLVCLGALLLISKILCSCHF